MCAEICKGDRFAGVGVGNCGVGFRKETHIAKRAGQFSANTVDPNFVMRGDGDFVSEPLRAFFAQGLHSVGDGLVADAQAFDACIVVDQDIAQVACVCAQETGAGDVSRLHVVLDLVENGCLLHG